METLEQPVVVERLLIYTNETEINRIVEDARIRCSCLNEVILSGVPVNKIRDLNSEKAIENYIFDRHLKQNKRMAMEFSSGKRQKSLIEDYILPANLEDTQRKLLQWLNFPIHRGGDKYQHLKFNDGKFELDTDTLEKEFVMRKLKFYVSGEQLVEFREIEAICKFFMKIQMPNNQVKDASYLNQRIEPISHCMYRPRWTYFSKQ